VKKYLVTGGAGFLGSHLCEELLKAGHAVISLDNLFSGQSKNIAHLLQNQNFNSINHDVTQDYVFEVDGIFNFASPASPIHYQRLPIETFKTSILGTLNALEMARRLKIPILQASTSEVYGDPQIHPQKEGYFGNVNPIGIRACYDEGKRGAETLCFDYARQYQTDSRVVRIFNTYGPRMRRDDGRVISNFVTQALANKDITIYGNGNQTRSFCYVDDLINGIIKVMELNIRPETPINIGNPHEYSIAEIAELIVKLTNSNSGIVYKDLPLDDPTKRRPDITLANETINWQPQIEIKDGLMKTIEYFQHAQS
jgi:UDP-glucuronate decarboxylase